MEAGAAVLTDHPRRHDRARDRADAGSDRASDGSAFAPPPAAAPLMRFCVVVQPMFAAATTTRTTKAIPLTPIPREKSHTVGRNVGPAGGSAKCRLGRVPTSH
jgi:hypothetical protein